MPLNSKLNRSLRSAMFVPGYMRKFLDKAVTFDCDAVILDLEDSVPEGCKPDARNFVREYLDAGMFSQQVFIRVNSLESGLLSADLDATLQA